VSPRPTPKAPRTTPEQLTREPDDVADYNGTLWRVGTWLLRNTASAALLAAPRSICRRWARAIYTAWPELDGLYVPSTMTGHPNIVLWNAAADSIPTMPSFSRPLTHPLVWSIAQAAAAEIRYRVL
jgi:hypothetical protein